MFTHSPIGERLTPATARIVLAMLLLLVAICVGVTFSLLASGFADQTNRGPGDVGLYHAEVARMRAGETYYDAAAAELTERGYPTRSLFNWRTPLPLWLAARSPDGFAQGLLGLCAATTLLIGLHAFARDYGTRTALCGGILLFGGMLPAFLAEVWIMPEVWSGVLIALSVMLYAINRSGAALVVGLAALFVRELAAPYCMVCLAMAIRNRSWREAGAWSVGIVAYLAFYVWHASHVFPRIAPDAIAHTQGWVRCGGLAFVISAMQMHGFLLLLPQAIAAVYLPLALFGFAGARSQWQQRAALTASLYVVAFGIVGQPFNQYWGSMIAPLFCLGAMAAPAALRESVRAAAGREIKSGLRTA